VDLHHLLLAGLPAHFESDHLSHAVGSCESRTISVAIHARKKSPRVSGA
jgi:hypothetical protein